MVTLLCVKKQESWAICRIFKKTNSMAQRALSHSWVSSLPETPDSDLFSVCHTLNASQSGSQNFPCATQAGSSIQFGSNNVFQHHTNAINYPHLDPMDFKSYPLPVSSNDIPANFMFSPGEMPMASMLLNLSPSILEEVEKSSKSIDFDQPQQNNGFPVVLPTETNGNLVSGDEKSQNTIIANNYNQLGNMRTVSFPFNLSPMDEWKLNLPWDSPPCLSEMSTSLPTNKCYT